MTCVSPQSNRKHPRYIILKVSLKLLQQKAYMRAPTRTAILPEDWTKMKNESALVDFYFSPPKNSEGESIFRDYSWQNSGAKY